MKSIIIKLDTIEKVKKFVNVITPLEGDFDLVSNRFAVDAKSIMGIFSLDLANTLRLDIHNDDSADRVADLMKEFM